VDSLPTVENYPWQEPSDLPEIQALRSEQPEKKPLPDADILEDKMLGAWLGRICGCLLGKPIEGIRTNELWPLLKETDNFPLRRYLTSRDATPERMAKYTYRMRMDSLADQIECAPVDDDTNYVVLAQVLLEKYGRDFTPAQVGQVWLDYQPKSAYCTAERVAFCNLTKGYAPPASARFQNPYREWIGAQIRGDYFGYINPGDPETAADMAWRDASISHIKNGIYGEMFAAAMIAEAAVENDLEKIILAGLSQIPATSRLYAAVQGVIQDFRQGVAYDEAVEKIHAAYNEHTAHGWCHTISNAMIVAAALLYGGGDYSLSICRAVQMGFDTDCNGATVGSIMGMRGGSKCIPECWTQPINGQLDTSIFGVGRIDLNKAAKDTLRHMPK